MGLAMYLTQEHYVKNWDHTKPEDRHTITIKKGDQDSPIDTSKISAIITQEMYWRKTNAIHQWFVINVQDGEDNCGNYLVIDDKLKELLDLVTQVLDDHSKAKDLLPTQGGFFFGGQEYDEWYFGNLEETKQTLTSILASEPTGNFYYHSSW